MTVGIVVVSHSQRLAEGVVEFASQMTHGTVNIVAAGGMDSGELGTSLDKVLRALESADTGDGVLIVVDLGSAALVAGMAVEQLPEERRARTLLSDAPVAEGAVLAAVEASIGSPLAQVAETAKEAATLDKGVADQAG